MKTVEELIADANRLVTATNVNLHALEDAGVSPPDARQWWLLHRALFDGQLKAATIQLQLLQLLAAPEGG